MDVRSNIRNKNIECEKHDIEFRTGMRFITKRFIYCSLNFNVFQDSFFLCNRFHVISDY